jgi:photosystem II stability/assembly factor-like uncharacterized protein
MTYLIAFILSNCKKDKVDNSNIPNTNIEGWEIDSIAFAYNWISPTDVDFLNSKTGYILGSNGYLIKTTDYAKSWSQSVIEKDSSGVMTSTMSFINDSTGYIYGTWNVLNGDFYGILYKTIDGGNHWTKQYYDSAYHLYSMKFFDSKHGIAMNWVNSGSYIMTTANGGLTWETANLNLDPSFRGLYYLGETCYATGTNQKIFKSVDYGYSWSTINAPKTSSNFLSGFYFIDEKTGFVDCVDKKYKTTDGGNTWHEINFPFNGFSTPFSPFEDFHFCNYNDGITMVDISAYNGGDFPNFVGTYIYTTTNGGNNWIRSDLLKQPFNAIDFISNDFAYCIGINNLYTLQKK